MNVGRAASYLWGDFRIPRKMVEVLCLPPDITFVFCRVVFLSNA